MEAKKLPDEAATTPGDSKSPVKRICHTLAQCKTIFWFSNNKFLEKLKDVSRDEISGMLWNHEVIVWVA